METTSTQDVVDEDEDGRRSFVEKCDEATIAKRIVEVGDIDEESEKDNDKELVNV